MAASMIIHVRFDLFGGDSSVQSSFEDVSSQNVIDGRSHGVRGATGSNFAAIWCSTGPSQSATETV